jgi:hypothetical protein
MNMIDSNREHYIDKKFDANISDADFINKLFLRVVAKKIRFENVKFHYTIFDTCYFRNSVFISCNFTGCRFVGTNFYGAKFSDCDFDYAVFEKTIISCAVLNDCCPGWDNLKLKFARELRVNFQGLGDSKSTNKAIRVELDATDVYLKQSWSSNTKYYRTKYKGIKRISKFFEWLNFRVLDIIWGNGENTLKLIKSILLVNFGMVVVNIIKFKGMKNFDGYIDSLIEMPVLFLGVATPPNYPSWYLAIISLIRLVAMGFFMSIILKRFNRR